MGSAALWSGAVVGTLAGAIDKKSDTGLLAAGIALNLERLVGFASGLRFRRPSPVSASSILVV